MRGFAAILGATTLALVLAACTGNGDSFDAGSVDDFPSGSVTTFADGEIIERTTPTESTGHRLPFGGEVVFHLVRTESGEFLALSARDTHSQCWVPWTSEHEFDGRTGWFRDPCHGSIYEVTGMRVFGPAPRDLDRYPVEARNGRVYVTLSDDVVIPGETRVEFIDPNSPPTVEASAQTTAAVATSTNVATAPASQTPTSTATPIEPMTIRIPTDDEVDLGDVTIDEILLGRVAVFADGTLCGPFAAGAGDLVRIGAAEQPDACHREGATLDLVDGAGRRLAQTFTFSAGAERVFENFAPLPPHSVYPGYICDYLDAEGIERTECQVAGPPGAAQ